MKVTVTGPAVDEKLVATVLYILRGCSPSRPGLTSLVKMLWYADFWHYREHLSTITNAEYVALQEGPVINNYRAMFDKLVDAELIARKDIPIQGRPHPKQEYEARLEPDEDLFSETELAILDRVVKRLGRVPGWRLSRMTHSEGPWPFVWSATAPNRTIPPVLFRWLDNLPDESDLEEAQNQIAARPELLKAIQELEGSSS